MVWSYFYHSHNGHGLALSQETLLLNMQALLNDFKSNSVLKVSRYTNGNHTNVFWHRLLMNNVFQSHVQFYS